MLLQTPAGKRWGNLALRGGCRAPDSGIPRSSLPSHPGSMLTHRQNVPHSASAVLLAQLAIGIYPIVSYFKPSYFSESTGYKPALTDNVLLILYWGFFVSLHHTGQADSAVCSLSGM